MSTNLRDELRQLVDEYHRDLLPTHDYRERRAQLLDRALAEEFLEAPRLRPVTAEFAVGDDVDPSVTRPRQPPSAPVEAVAAEPVPQPVVRSEPPATRGGIPWLWLAPVVVLAAAIALWFASRGGDQDSVPSQQVQSEAIPPAQQLLDDFLADDEWDAPRLAQLSQDWQAFDNRARRAAKNSPEFRAVARELRDRLLLVDAASATADATNTRRAPLDGLADALGIKLRNRPDALPQNEARAQPPATSVQKTATVTPTREPPPDDIADTPPAPRQLPPPTAPSSTASARQPAKSAAEPTIAPVKTARPPDTAALPTVPDAVAVVSDALPDDALPTPVARAAAGGCQKSMLNGRRKYCRDRFANGEAGPKMALVRVAPFQMGSASLATAEPVHRVELAAPYAIATTEVSFAEFDTFCRATKRPCPVNPWADSSLPVVNVSWADANAYADWLSAQLGATYRLPSEAEWEFATRAGTNTAYPFGDEILSTQATFSGSQSVQQPRSASGDDIKANAFGLLHSVGNVREWVADHWQADFAGAPADGSVRQITGASQHVVRGGSYADRESGVQSASRDGLTSTAADTVTGFRVARSFQD